MTGVRKVQHGDLVYETVDADIAAGTVVVPSTTASTAPFVPPLQGMKAAGDAATNVLGVCANDCVTAAHQLADQYPTGPAPMSAVGLDLTTPDTTSTVYNDDVTEVFYTPVAVAYGKPLCSAAGGKVRELVVGTDSPLAYIGWCAEVGGVSSAGGLKKARINR